MVDDPLLHLDLHLRVLHDAKFGAVVAVRLLRKPRLALGHLGDCLGREERQNDSQDGQQRRRVPLCFRFVVESHFKLILNLIINN